ncbi:Ger(x)C family spore germination protein [Paenibacillus flagellatus]|uniref:Ger(x)C family spore germination protein n=1 Tax=Paenibacillus flagellatus TaxID=2211139 RepID=UPI001305327C|nr:Ger(x)C family spore germination protein [Paenibacillus flagellatus]
MTRVSEVSLSSKRAATAPIAVLLAAAVLLAGCWDSREVNELAVVMAAAIDQADEQNIELSVQVYNPRTAGGGGQVGQMSGGSGGGAGAFVVRSAVGSTMADAMSKLQEKLPRQIFWGHGEVFVIGEAVASKGLREHMDFLLRSPEIRDKADVFIVKGKAKPLLTLPVPLEGNTAQTMGKLADIHLGVQVSIINLTRMLAGSARGAILPLVQLSQSEEKAGDSGKIPFMTGAGVLKNDKLIGYIDVATMRGAMWVRDEIELATVTVTPTRTERGDVTVRLVRSRTKLVPRIEDGKWAITVESEAQGDILQNTTNVDFGNPLLAGRLEQDFNDQIERRMTGAIEKLQKMNADVLGFSQAFHRRYPKEWNKVKDRWDEQFPHVQATAVVKVKIERHGLSSSGAVRPNDEVQAE